MFKRKSVCVCDATETAVLLLFTTCHTDNDVNNQQDATTFSFIKIFNSALHVSGDKFAHTQELFSTVYTAFGTVQKL